MNDAASPPSGIGMSVAAVIAGLSRSITISTPKNVTTEVVI